MKTTKNDTPVLAFAAMFVYAVCAALSYWLVPYVCAGLEISFIAATIIVNITLFGFAILTFIFLSRLQEAVVVTVLTGFVVFFLAVIFNLGPRDLDDAVGKEGFIVNCSVQKPNGEDLTWGKVFKAISPNGAVLVSMKSRTKYKEDSNREPEKTIVYAQVYDYDGNKLSEEEYNYDYDENFRLDDEKIKYIKMRLRVDKNIYLRHQIN